MNVVDAVKTPDEIKSVALLLHKHKGMIYSDLWMFGVNAALRITDLLSITTEDAKNGVIIIKEGKTNKRRKITLNDSAMKIVKKRTRKHPDHIYLFQVDSNRAKNKAISRSAVGTAFREVGQILGITLGTHSMRKTFGWVMHSAGAPIERICKLLNHSTPAVTMVYIGLVQEDIDSAYKEFEICF
jgi:integrase